MDNTLTVFHSDRNTRLAELKRLASNAQTDFTVSDHLGNVFHACVTNNAENRLKAIKEGLDSLTSINHTVKEAINMINSRGETPLYAASKSYATHAYGIAKILLEIGADPTIPNSKGMTPDARALICYTSLYVKTPEIYNLLSSAKNKKEGLHGCLKDGDFIKALQLINADADVSQLDDEKNTTMLLAIKSNSGKTVNEDQLLHILCILYKKNVDINHKNNRGESVLTLAVQKEYIKVLDFLLFQTNADTSIKDYSGNTIFHVAARGKTTSIIKLMLESRACSEVNTKNGSGQTPLHFVEHPEVCELLCQANPALIQMKDNSNLEPKRYFVGKPFDAQLRAIVDKFDQEKEIKAPIPGALESLKVGVSEIGSKIDVPGAVAELGKVVIIAAKDGIGEAAIEAINYGVDKAKAQIPDSKKKEEEDH